MALAAAAISRVTPVAPAGDGWIDSLYRVALRMTGSAPAAEDLVVEAHLRTARGEPSTDAATTDRVRLFRGLWSALAEKGHLDPAPSDLPARLAGAAGPRELDVPLALAALPVSIRGVVLLDLEGLGYDEIAAAVALSREAVVARLYEGRRILRAQLVAPAGAGVAAR